MGLNSCMQVFVTNEMLIITSSMDFHPQICLLSKGLRDGFAIYYITLYIFLDVEIKDLTDITIKTKYSKY